MEKLRVGQTIYYTGRFVNGLQEGTIEKIGTKYIYIKERKRSKYDKNTLAEITEGGVGGRIYLNSNEYHEEILYNKLTLKFRTYNWNNLNLEQLKAIDKIVKGAIE